MIYFLLQQASILQDNIKLITLQTRPAWAGFKNCGTRLPPYQGNKIGSKIGSKNWIYNWKVGYKVESKVGSNAGSKIGSRIRSKIGFKVGCKVESKVGSYRNSWSGIRVIIQDQDSELEFRVRIQG